MATDPLALLRCWAVTVELGGFHFTVPALPAADWIEAILTGSPIPDLLSDEAQQRIVRDQFDDTLADDEVRDATRDAMAAAAGRPWWEVQRLVALLRERADDVGGELLRAGFDFERRSLGAFCAQVYATAVRNMDEKDRLKFDSALRQPPVEVLAQDEDALSAAFLAAMRASGAASAAQSTGEADQSPTL